MFRTLQVYHQGEHQRVLYTTHLIILQVDEACSRLRDQA